MVDSGIDRNIVTPEQVHHRQRVVRGQGHRDIAVGGRDTDQIDLVGTA